MTFRRAKHNSTAGFTLLELILVMIILCTVLAMAAPSLRGFFSSRRMYDMAEQIQLLIRCGRIQAVSEARYYRLEFDLNRHEYGLAVLNENGYVPLEKGFGMRYPLPTDLELQFENLDRAEGKYVVPFDLQGHAKQCRIRMCDAKKNRIDLICLSPIEGFELVVLNENDV